MTPERGRGRRQGARPDPGAAAPPSRDQWRAQPTARRVARTSPTERESRVSSGRASSRQSRRIRRFAGLGASDFEAATSPIRAPAWRASWPLVAKMGPKSACLRVLPSWPRTAKMRARPARSQSQRTPQKIGPRLASLTRPALARGRSPASCRWVEPRDREQARRADRIVSRL